MNICNNYIGVEITPSVIRFASLARRGAKLHLSASGEACLPYRDFDDLYDHAKECGDTLCELFERNGIQSGKCIATLSAIHAKTKSIALPLMRRRALLRMLSVRHFWHKHLGVGNDDYSYTWLTTVHDKKRYRLSLYLMAVPRREITFYKAVFAHTRLSLNVLTLSKLAYYGIHRRHDARRLLVVSEGEVYLAHLGLNVFSQLALLSDNECRSLFKNHGSKETHDDATSSTVLQHLSDTLHERLRSESRDTQTLWLAADLSSQAIARLDVLLSNITLKPLDVCENIGLVPQLQTISATMYSVIALARWLATDAGIFKTEANFIHNHSTAYYRSAACWVLSSVVTAMLFFYYQHITGLNAVQQPTLQYQTQLRSQHSEYKNKIKLTQQHTERRQQLQAHIQFLEAQNRRATDFWSRLGALIPQTVKIETIDCRWQNSCFIAGEAPDYGQIIRFAEQLEQLDVVGEVVIDSSRVTQNRTAETMQFAIACKLNDTIAEQ